MARAVLAASSVLAAVTAQASTPWSVLPGGTPPAAESASIVCTTNCASLLRFGGLQPDTLGTYTASNTLYSYSSSLGWVQVPQEIAPGAPQWPPARARHCAAWLGSSMYVTWGRYMSTRDNSVKDFNDVWRLDGVASANGSVSWSQLSIAPDPVAGSPSPRSGHVCAPMGRGIILHGGAVSNAVFDEVWLLDLVLNAWRLLTPDTSSVMPSLGVTTAAAAPGPVYAHAGVFIPAGNALVIHGGRTSFTGNAVLSDIYVLTLDTRGAMGVPGPWAASWRRVVTTGSAAPGRAFAVAFAIQSRFCVHGGYDSSADGNNVFVSLDVLCINLFPALATRTATSRALQPDVQILPLPGVPSSSPSSAPPVSTPSWLVMGLSSGATVAAARYRHVAFAVGANSVAAGGATSSLFDGSAVVIHSGRMSTGAVVGDTWLLSLPPATSSVWASYTVTTNTPDLLMISYLAYSTALTLLTTVCFLCMVRRESMCWYMGLRCCCAQPPADDRGTPRYRRTGAVRPIPIAARGVDPIVIASLPTIVFKKRAAVAAHAAATVPAAAPCADTSVAALSTEEGAGSTSALQSSVASPRGWVHAEAEGGQAETGVPQQSNKAVDAGSLELIVVSHSEAVAAASVRDVALDAEAGVRVTSAPDSAATTGAAAVAAAGAANVSAHTDQFDMDTCTICLAQFDEGDELKLLPCMHLYHAACIDTWLGGKRWCPLCKSDVMAAAV